jgi:hypothetical protein
VAVLAPRPEFGSRPAIHRRAKRARRGAEDDGFEVTRPVFLFVISVVAAALFLVVLVQPTSGASTAAISLREGKDALSPSPRVCLSRATSSSASRGP